VSKSPKTGSGAKVVRGHGITAYEVDERIANDPAGALAEDEEQAAGLEFGMFDFEARDIEEWIQGAISRAKRAGNVNEQLQHEQSPLKYAMLLKMMLMNTRQAMRENQVIEAARNARLLGELWGEVRMKLRWEPAARSGVKVKGNLASGRAEGVKKRQANSVEKRAILERAVADLFSPGGKGFTMTNEEIADFLLEREISTYSRSSTIKHVGRIAAKLRQP
jgi:hypothetical protein